MNVWWNLSVLDQHSVKHLSSNQPSLIYRVIGHLVKIISTLHKSRSFGQLTMPAARCWALLHADCPCQHEAGTMSLRGHLMSTRSAARPLSLNANQAPAAGWTRAAIKLCMVRQRSLARSEVDRWRWGTVSNDARTRTYWNLGHRTVCPIWTLDTSVIRYGLTADIEAMLGQGV